MVTLVFTNEMLRVEPITKTPHDKELRGLGLLALAGSLSEYKNS